PGPDLRVVSARGPGPPPDRLRGRRRATWQSGRPMREQRPVRAQRVAPAARRPVVLVYNPDEAAAYAKTIRPPRGRAVTIHTAATEAEAAAAVGEADVGCGWKFPASLYAGAPRLAWQQVMGAGVDWVFVPELPPRVVVTRAPGVFGAWMSEYVL